MGVHWPLANNNIIIWCDIGNSVDFALINKMNYGHPPFRSVLQRIVIFLFIFERATSVWNTVHLYWIQTKERCVCKWNVITESKRWTIRLRPKQRHDGNAVDSQSIATRNINNKIIQRKWMARAERRRAIFQRTIERKSTQNRLSFRRLDAYLIFGTWPHDGCAATLRYIFNYFPITLPETMDFDA